MTRIISRFQVEQVYVAIFMLCAVFLPYQTRAETIDQQKVPPEILNILKESFEMITVIELINSSPDRSSSKQYLQEQKRFHFVATQEQEPMMLDGYSVGDNLAAPIIGYSIFYYGTNGPLAIADLSVNFLNMEIKTQIEGLINQALDYISNPDGSILYYLGIYEIDDKRVIKIMIRKNMTPVGLDYVVRYAVSYH